jgi:hypothetical protein
MFFLHFRGTRKSQKSYAIFVQAMVDGIPDEGGLWYSAIHNQEMNCLDSASGTEGSVHVAGGAVHDSANIAR